MAPPGTAEPAAAATPAPAPAPTNGNLGAAPPEARYGAAAAAPPPPPAAPPPVPPPPPPPPEASGDAEPPEPGTMTILEHLEELRERIIKAGLAVVAGMAISAVWLSGRVLELLIAIAPTTVININPPSVFFEYLKVTVFTGVAIAMPVVLYQAMMFVLPALTPKEKRYSYIIVPGSAICFAGGVAFGYFLLIPTALEFLKTFAGQFVTTSWDIAYYLSFVTGMLFWMGVTFQTPLVVFILVSLGVVSHQRLSRYRKYAFLVAFVVAAIITPTPDPLTQTLVGVPLYLLYELGLLLARFVR